MGGEGEGGETHCLGFEGGGLGWMGVWGWMGVGGKCMTMRL